MSPSVAENEIEIGAGEPTQTALAFNDNIGGLRLEHIDDFGAPRTFPERLGIDHTFEDSVRLRAELVIVLGEGDWREDDRCPHTPTLMDIGALWARSNLRL
jgi:hypothetical protein